MKDLSLKRVVLGAAATLITAGQVTSASAAPVPRTGTTRQPMSDALFTGPLVAPNATALPAGHWNIEPYVVDSIQYGQFDNDWDSHNTSNSHAYRSVTLLEYGFTDRLTIALLPSFGYNVADEGPDSQGVQLGDTTLRMQYMVHAFSEGSLLPTVALSYAQNFPTGKYDGLQGHVADGLGSGVLSSTVGLFTQDYFWLPNGRILRARLNFTYTFADADASVDGVSVYGTPAGFNGHVETGDSYSADLAFEYSLTRHWAPAIDIVYNHSQGGVIQGSRAADGLITPVRSSSDSSESISIAPALEYNWNKHYGVIVGAEVVAAGRNAAATVTPQAALNIYY
ncbi:transporter [Salinisphaera sp. Q1T1-3]|uniref:transporter n=1 Tax=Salinisphaera sp. Q1T1-3 TaxID=2321229 RepID=UPI000E756DC2|nr:transporter [Salinisphaera sp. Q1T1-3]RJS94044.1 transporter [Salinisphaera sp. Q1T1-3]